MRFSKRSLDGRNRAGRNRVERGRTAGLGPSPSAGIAPGGVVGFGSPPELETIAFHPAVESAATQAQRLRRLAHVSVKALQGLAYENSFDLFDAELFEVLALRTLHIQAEVG